METPLTIRANPGRAAVGFLAALAFIAVGYYLLTVTPTVGRYASDAGRVILRAVGALSVVFGLAGGGAFLYTVTRPLLRLHKDRIEDPRRRLTIPYGDIRRMTVHQRTEWLNKVRQLLLTAEDPAKYAALERLSKRAGLTAADVTLDLSLATQADFDKARDYIAARIAER